jgi:hypothetical protein
VSLPTLSEQYLLHCNAAGKGTITLMRLPLISRKPEYSMNKGGFEDWSKLAQSEITHNLGSLVKCFTKEMFAHLAAASQVRDNGYGSVGNDTTMAIAMDLRCSRSKHRNCSMNSRADTLIFKFDIVDSYQTSNLRLNGKTIILQNLRKMVDLVVKDLGYSHLISRIFNQQNLNFGLCTFQCW